jgi:poly-gamma-glutamate synthesis protein (capsule biosynthesis protein)
VGGRFGLIALAACGGQLAEAPAPQPHVEETPPCVPDAEWRYALVGSLYTPIESVTADDFAAAWKANKIAATDETRTALQLAGGAPLAPNTRPELAPDRWAIVPAHELEPAQRVIAIDDKHPLDEETTALLVAKRCGKPNIDHARVTTIAMTGTSALTRFVARLMEKHGAAYPTRDVEPWLRSADLVHISHEVSMVPTCDPDKTQKQMCARESYIEALEASHAKIIELTGSHLADYGRKWIDHTLNMYAERGWVWFGGGRNQFEAAAPRIVEHNGNRVAFLGCNMPWTTSKYIVEGAGPAACDVERLRSDVADLRRRGFVPIVSIQHEEVYEHDPPDLVVRDFRRIAEAGAAVVFGSQAHSAHPWDVHHGAYVHYGAGNFLFDQQMKVTRDGVHDKLYIYDGRLLSVGQFFTRIEEWGKPRPMNPAERATFVAKLGEVRKKLPAAKPWAAPRPIDPRRRNDSFLVGKELRRIVVTTPTTLEANRRYPLIVDFVGDAVDDNAFVARLHGKSKQQAVAALASTYLQAKYPIDPAQVTVRAKKR